MSASGLDFTLIGKEHHRQRSPSTYPVVLELENHGTTELRAWLEMVPECVILSPGHRIELLARPDEGLLPLDLERTADGWVVHAAQLADPDWHVRFKGHRLKPASDTRLADFEHIEGDACAMRYPLAKAEAALFAMSTSQRAS